MSSASAFTRRTRCAATRLADWPASAARGWSSAASTPRCSPKRRMSRAGLTRSSKATATSSGPASSRTVLPGGRCPCTTGAASTAIRSRRPGGTFSSRTPTCGRRCRPCEAVRSTVRSARSGEQTARSLASAAASIGSSRRSSSAGDGSGSKFIALADDNFYPVTFDDIAAARRRSDQSRLCRNWEALRQERFDLMAKLAELPEDLVFYTQITMEAAEDTEFLDAMRKAHILGALVGVEAVTPEGLKDVYKGFNLAGDALVARLKTFRRHGVHVLGSFIFGLPSDREDTFDATVALAEKSDLTFAQFVLLTPFPGTLDFDEVGQREGPQRDEDRRCARHPALADPAEPPAQASTPNIRRYRSKKSACGRKARGISSTAGAASGRAPASSSRCAAASLSFWCRRCTDRCTPIRASPPTVHASRDRSGGPV